MDESAHSREVRAALSRLEEALLRHGDELRSAPGEVSDPALQALLRTIDVMELEAQRLRAELAQE
ncbi:hypothetical protein H8N03_24680 [Ramlibacter sp. USB13]|uniref:Uncharacterized protein n=1 Tax=Ramlibacter cellulosilyticus TaxID=2764187 RepID=A0A923MVQ4_9BURK|nr:hypothetical protein [Ramlibacter cellulosilyticus]MBC5786158.1 hypothetical protein [Ramlibacter cellulosilyticus]